MGHSAPSGMMMMMSLLRSNRWRQMLEWGRALLAQVAMVISCSHQACMAVIKVSKIPRGRFAQRFQAKNSARRAGANCHRWQTGKHPRSCVQRLHHSCFFPRPPSMSSQSPHLESRCIAQRLFARTAARVHPAANCITLASTAGRAAVILCSQRSSGRALWRGDDGKEPPSF